MTKNKRLIILGSVMLTVPIIATVSCSTTWTKWSVDSDPDASKNKIEYVSKIAPDNLWKVRDMDVLENAWDATTSTLDLSKLNNQYELMDLIINILKLKPPAPMDTYWDVDHYDEMKTYLSEITKSQIIKLKFNNTTTQITWNVTTTINNAIRGIDEYLANPNESLKAFNIELPNGHGLNSDGQPVDFTQVATVGLPLTSNPVVAALLQKDNDFALALSKLVNLPKVTFDNFNQFLKDVNQMLSAILRSKQFNDWSIAKGLDFTVSQTGVIGIYAIDYPSDRDDHFKGIFMLRALK